MKGITELSRKLRKQQTPSEEKLWNILRGRKVLGKKFLRQHPIPIIVDGMKKYYIADFYCAKEKLVIEVDGEIHEFRREYDQLRTMLLEQLGLHVIRFTNQDIVLNPENVVSKIIVKINSPTSSALGGLVAPL